MAVVAPVVILKIRVDDDLFRIGLANVDFGDALEAVQRFSAGGRCAWVRRLPEEDGLDAWSPLNRGSWHDALASSTTPAGKVPVVHLRLAAAAQSYDEEAFAAPVVADEQDVAEQIPGSSYDVEPSAPLPFEFTDIPCEIVDSGQSESVHTAAPQPSTSPSRVDSPLLGAENNPFAGMAGGASTDGPFCSRAGDRAQHFPQFGTHMGSFGAQMGALGAQMGAHFGAMGAHFGSQLAGAGYRARYVPFTPPCRQQESTPSQQWQTNHWQYEAPEGWQISQDVMVVRSMVVQGERRRIVRGMITGSLRVIDADLVLEDCMVTGRISLEGSARLLLVRGGVTGSVSYDSTASFENHGWVTGRIGPRWSR